MPDRVDLKERQPTKSPPRALHRGRLRSAPGETMLLGKIIINNMFNIMCNILSGIYFRAQWEVETRQQRCAVPRLERHQQPGDGELAGEAADRLFHR
jgi:hypothetical protein